VAPKITNDNKDKILSFLPGATKLKLSFFLQTIDERGNDIVIEPTIPLKLNCSSEMIEKLERLQGLLVQSQTKVNKEGVIERAIDTLLEKIDPIKKEQRREKRNTVKQEKATSNTKNMKQEKTQLPLNEILITALSVFALKSPSLLAYDKEINRPALKGNL
jgi:hypothetical protein